MVSIQSFLYIDPGTGSMLFTIIIGLVSTLVFALRDYLLKLKVFVSGDRKAKLSDDKLSYVIFSDDKRYWNVFKPICDEFERRGIECNYWTASSNDPALSEEYEYVKCEFIGTGNKPYARLNMMKAYICLATTTGLNVYQWKRSKYTDYYIHTYHAVGDGTGYRMFALDFFDAVLLTGEFQEYYIRTLEEKRKLPAKETKLVGSTYLDVMKDKYNTINKEISKADNITVLVAPTWGDSSILNRFGDKFVDCLLATDYNIIIRPHPQSLISDAELIKRLEKKYPNNDRLEWNYDNDNFEVLSKSDILITDFSGIIYDYCFVFDKPIIYADTGIDNSPYDAAWFDEEVWRLRILPELGRRLDSKDFDCIGDIIKDVINNDTYKAGRDKYRKEAWQCVGNAAKNTVDYMIEKYNELTDNS